jgi:hypothetical protein
MLFIRMPGYGLTRLPAPRFSSFVTYVCVAIIFFGLPVIFDPATAHVGYLADPSLLMWCMVWWPYAIAHHLNPFVTHAIWAPGGYNLAWVTSIPAVAIAMAPVTVACGPVVSYNIAALLAPALSGWCAFLLCRRVTRSFPASLIGGFIYGFSPYENAHVYAGHISLSLMAVAPLCVLLVLLLADNEISSKNFILSLTALLVTQCFISSEILATMTVFGAAALFLAIVLMPIRRELIALLPAIAISYAIATLFATPFLYYALGGDGIPREPFYPTWYFSSDLMSFVIPHLLLALSPSAAAAVAAHFVGQIGENTAYLGLPLLAIITLHLWKHRADRAARLYALIYLLLAIATLGPVLHCFGRPLFALPWALVERLPLIKYALPGRFTAYIFLVTAVVVSRWFAESDSRFRYSLTVLALASIFPQPVLAVHRWVYDNPAFFARGLYRQYLRRGENVLVIPYGINGASMAWQAESWMYFRMPGGWVTTTPESFRRWPIVNTLLTRIPVADSAAQLREFAAAHGVDAIVVANSADQTERAVVAGLGLPALKAGGVLLYRLSTSPAEDPTEMRYHLEQVASEKWFAELLDAARDFLIRGNKLAELTPAKACALGLLSDSKWSRDLKLMPIEAAHGVSNGMWIGPGQNGSIAAGLFVSPVAADFLVSRYELHALEVLYPYPHLYRTGAKRSDDSEHLLLITITPEFLGGRPRSGQK